MSSVKFEKISLLEWVMQNYNDEKMREVFLNMDIALKYIHDHGYCIENFHPSKIFILNNKSDHIEFECLMPLSNNVDEKKNMIKEDIFNSALIQIALYTKTLKYLTPTFLREHYDEMSKHIPEGDVPYYRGVVQRGASVYFSEFAIERTKRDLEQLEKQINEMDESKNSNSTGMYRIPQQNLENDSINDSIYKTIIHSREAAFISGYIIPGIILITVIILLIAIVLFKM